MDFFINTIIYAMILFFTFIVIKKSVKSHQNGTKKLEKFLKDKFISSK